MEQLRQGATKARLLLLLAAGVLALLAVPAAQSTQGQPVIAGVSNTASSGTSLDTQGHCALPDCNGLIARASGNGIGFYGNSPDGTGVYGDSPAGFALQAISGTGYGLWAQSRGLNPTLFAENDNTSGGVAIEALNTAPNWTAIYGRHDAATSGYGVYGEAPIGIGVQGKGSANGVRGFTTSVSGIGVKAENSAGGKALAVSGKASFSRSGVLGVSTGATSVTKTGISLAANSFVLATLQTNAAGLYVQGAVPTPATSSFKVFFSKAVPAGTKVAWIVMN